MRSCRRMHVEMDYIRMEDYPGFSQTFAVGERYILHQIHMNILRMPAITILAMELFASIIHSV
jgi:hypothetical protein